MSNPFAQIEMIRTNAVGDDGEAKVGMFWQMGIKLLVAGIITMLVFIYLDKTSSLNKNTPEENQRLYGYHYKPDTGKTDKEKPDASSDASEPTAQSTGASTGKKPALKRKT